MAFLMLNARKFAGKKAFIQAGCEKKTVEYLATNSLLFLELAGTINLKNMSWEYPPEKKRGYNCHGLNYNVPIFLDSVKRSKELKRFGVFCGLDYEG
jgi:hypothetical protein